MKNILFIYGTRPEAIKMAPLIKEFERYQDCFKVSVCLTGQHKQMIENINKFFRINIDYNMNIMLPNQTLFDITIRCLSGFSDVFDKFKPDMVFVQGDTTSVMAGALSSFYYHIPVAHLEAGLRSYNKYSPFPEEMNRIITGHIADYHFAPTIKAVENLKNERIENNVFMVGNTVIDALNLGLNIIKNSNEDKYKEYFSYLNFTEKIILVTCHRRENIGEVINNICHSILYIANKYNNIHFVYPVHLNPNIRNPVKKILDNIRNVHIIEPLDYQYLIWIMEKCFFVLTDSGGIQEEAPALGKPVLVMRDVTERQEGIDAGTAKLVGTKYDDIVFSIETLINDEKVYNYMSNAVNPYGDGNSSKKILEIIKNID